MSHRLQVLVPEALEAEIRKAATRGRISKGEWVRQAIEVALRERSPQADPLARLARLDAPTGDLDQMLAEIDRGRG
ncbi:MAG: hypothetical protein ABIV06_03335 [Thermoanaerobaculia bacterium]